MKKWLALLMVALMLVSILVGCGTPDREETSTSTEDTTSQPQNEPAEETETEAPDYTAVKVGMLFDNVIIAQGWHKEQADSMFRAFDNLGMDPDTQLIYVENVMAGTPDVESTLVQMVDEGCNLIIGTSSGYVTSFETAAQTYPDVYFLEFEGAQADNLTPYTMWDIEAIFMLGYGAGLMSESNEMGFIAPFPQASVVRAVNAWAAGAKAANPDATVQVMWVNSWFDPAAEKECAHALLNEDITCIGYYGSSTSVATACEENGAYSTGFAEELHGAAPNAILNTFEWNWTPIYEQAITNAATGNWTTDIMVIGMAEDGARVRNWNDTVMSVEMIAQCEEMYAQITSGEYIVMEGPIFDNEGNQIKAAGETFTLEEMTNCSFLLDNIIGSLT